MLVCLTHCQTPGVEQFRQNDPILVGGHAHLDSPLNQPVRRDLTDVLERGLTPAGSLSAHSRPVECMAGVAHSETSVTLMTADTMGVIKIWKLERESGPNPRWRSDLQDTLDCHRTRVTEILYGAGQIWTGKIEY